MHGASGVDPQSPAPDESPDAVPADPAPFRACRQHAERPAIGLCDRCGDFLCALCHVRFDARDLCPGCLARLRPDLLRTGTYIAWEDRRRLGTVRALLRSVGAALASPRAFAERVPVAGGLVDPLLFACVMRGLVLFAYGVAFTLFYLLVGVATGETTALWQAALQAVLIPVNFLQALVLLFFLAGLLHVGVLVAAGRSGFEATFRIYAYGRAVDVVELVPILGPFVALGLRAWLYAAGLRSAHGIGAGPAWVIALLPVLLMLLFMLLFAAGVLGLVVLAVVLAGGLG